MFTWIKFKHHSSNEIQFKIEHPFVFLLDDFIIITMLINEITFVSSFVDFLQIVML